MNRRPADYESVANDPDVRKAARQVVKPLETSGIDVFEIRDADRHVVDQVRRKDLRAFDLPLVPEQEIRGVDPARLVALEVVKPSFREDLTWVFTDGSGGRISARMQDQTFAKRVQRGERAFAKGDILRVRLETRSYVTSEGLRTEHSVVAVLEEINAARQPSLLPAPSDEAPDRHSRKIDLEDE